ncbi:mechanosensitive ion channel [Candidatus Woesearchaeota archaeon]|nr:mechanosensitive ion channel [Candidatus Woesearchaeota archaeon]
MESTSITKISAFLDSMFRPMMMKIVVALLILLVSFITGRLLGKLIEKILKSFEVNKTFHRTTKMTVHLEQGISKTVAYFIGLIGIIMALDYLNLALVVGKILLVILLSLILISIILGMKDFVPNLIAWMRIKRNRSFLVRDRVKVYGIEGEIKKISIFETKMQTNQGDTVFIPNSLFIRKKFRVI